MLAVNFIVALACCFFGLGHALAGDQEGPSSVEQQINHLKQVAHSNPEGSPASVSAWQQILGLDPRNLEAHVMLGWSLIMTNRMDLGVHVIEAAFDPSRVSPTIDPRFPQTYTIAATIGRYHSQKREYAAAQHFTKLALELSKVHGRSPASNPDGRGDLCVRMQLASMFDYFPASTEAADAAIAAMTSHADELLALPSWSIEDAEVSVMPGGAPDPYVHCLLGIFELSFHYRADVASVASKHYQMAIRGWPALNRTADFVQRYDEEDEHKCIDRKIRLTVISAVITEGHSNSESFGGILSHLDRDIFDVTYVLVAEQGDTRIAGFTKKFPSDRSYIWLKEESDMSNGAWTTRWASTIESFEADIIWYFDLSMSSYARRLGMQRLAPVQINTNGHPVTSGIDRSVVQYFISWEASELPLERAQTHYTEELKMVPADKFFLYYLRRILPNQQVSRMDGQAFGHLTRADFGLPSDKRIYLCMQKPFKYMSEFDDLICGIMKSDSEGVVVLHRDTSAANQQLFENRLSDAGCELSRITFFEQQPHHRLLAMYKESTVILDSYPAGGDTTTREVLEMGKPLVTLPGRLLGGRWSLGYLNSIGLKESTKKALIATNADEYVKLAVRLATDDVHREAVEADLRQCSTNIFEREDAVSAWQELLIDISPYQRCGQGNEEFQNIRQEL